jgi:hypothetical protein
MKFNKSANITITHRRKEPCIMNTQLDTATINALSRAIREYVLSHRPPGHFTFVPPSIDAMHSHVLGVINGHRLPSRLFIKAARQSFQDEGLDANQFNGYSPECFMSFVVCASH